MYTPGNFVGSQSILETSRYVERSVAAMIIGSLLREFRGHAASFGVARGQVKRERAHQARAQHA